MESTKSDWRVLEFFTPINESLDEEDDFLIRGVAINETTTLNNVKYVAEELSAAAPSFRNVPILLDHKNEVTNIVGRTTENVNFNPQMKRIEFEAKIMDEKIKEMIRDKRIGSVSIGAKVNDLIEEEDGSMKAIGLMGLEISLVAVPGDNQATLAQALKQSFHLKEMAMKNETIVADTEVNKHGGITKMTEATEEQEKPVETPAEEEAKVEAEEPAVEAPAEEPAAESTEDVKAEMAGLKNQISEIKGLLMMKKKIQEEAEVEEPKEEVKNEPVAEPVDETKGEVATEEKSTEEMLNKIDGLIVEKSRQGYALYRDYSTIDENTKLKRLVI